MKTKTYYFFLFILTICLASCKPADEEQSELLSNPDFVSLTFSENDSVPGLEKAVFTLLDDSVTITNVDSLPFQTRIDSVIPNFYFKSSYATYAFSQKDTILLQENSVVDFTGVVTVRNFAADGKKSKDYKVKVNVHQVEPELYIWEKLSGNITSYPGSEQKALYFNGKFLYFLSNGISNYVYSTANPSGNWEEKKLDLDPVPTGGLRLQYIVAHNGRLFVSTNDNKLYTSSDGIKWSIVNYTPDNDKIYNLLFSLKENIWAIFESKAGSYYFASSADGTTWTTKSTLPDGFPIGNYASLVFKSRMGNPKAIILGGNDPNGTLKKTNWSTENGEYWVNLGREDSTLGSVAGAALVQYDDKLLIFGGMDNNGMITTNFLRESKDQGLSWSVPDSAYNHLPEEYGHRSYLSAFVVEEDKRIYLIGGKNNAVTYSDVWTGKMNRMYFND